MEFVPRVGRRPPLYLYAVRARKMGRGYREAGVIGVPFKGGRCANAQACADLSFAPQGAGSDFCFREKLPRPVNQVESPSPAGTFVDLAGKFCFQTASYAFAGAARREL
ncbi:hypothetical protein KCP71_15375 [Salmonella enterica subsp. enterica]|nr:hypothetical protein KCP71_15375 [Salmonella enterica subsp. enterica]